MNDRCNALFAKIRIALAPKGQDLFQPFLRCFATVERLLPEVEKEGFFTRHLARPAADFDPNQTVEVSIGAETDPRIGVQKEPLGW